MERRIGVVRKYIEDRGFGFLRVLLKGDVSGKAARIDYSHPDVFLHFKQLKSAGIAGVEVGDVLEFDVVQAEKGLVASNVSLVR